MALKCTLLPDPWNRPPGFPGLRRSMTTAAATSRLSPPESARLLLWRFCCPQSGDELEHRSVSPRTSTCPGAPVLQRNPETGPVLGDMG